MKRRCDHCKSKGGWQKQLGRMVIFVSCAHCLGKGVWWPSKRPGKTEKHKERK